MLFEKFDHSNIEIGGKGGGGDYVSISGIFMVKEGCANIFCDWLSENFKTKT
jgi:hypothetical protein